MQSRGVEAVVLDDVRTGGDFCDQALALIDLSMSVRGMLRQLTRGATWAAGAIQLCCYRLHMRNCFCCPACDKERDDFFEGVDLQLQGGTADRVDGGRDIAQRRRRG